MTACLSDHVLWSIAEGFGTAEEREHRERCALCDWRAKRLAADMAVISKVLGSEPPPPSRAERPAVRWTMRQLALAAALLLVFTGTLVSRHHAPPSVMSHDGGSPALHQTATEVGDDTALADAPDAEEVVASALTAADPCEWQPDGCEDIDQPLF